MADLWFEGGPLDGELREHTQASFYEVALPAADLAAVYNSGAPMPPWPRRLVYVPKNMSREEHFLRVLGGRPIVMVLAMTQRVDGRAVDHKMN